MSDNRIFQRLEEQLRDAHATNAELRDRVAEADRIEKAANHKAAQANADIAQFEKACARQKAAEDHAAAAQRKCEQAERELLSARGRIEELNARLTRLQAEADAFNELNARIEKAKHAAELFSLSPSDDAR